MSEYKMIKTETLDAICQSIRNAENSEDIVKISKVPERIDGLTVEIERLNTIIDKKSEFNKKLFEGTLTKITEEDLEGVTKLVAYCIEGQKNLKRVDIPKSVVGMENDCFSDCPNLKELKLPFIGQTREKPSGLEDLFSDAPSGLEIELTNALELTNTFENTTIKKVILNEGIEVIPMHAFDSSTIQEVKLPSTITTIESYAFSGCNKLVNIELPTNLLGLDDSCFADSGLISIAIPDSVTFLGNNAFDNSSLQEIHLGNGIKTIPKSCFRQSSLERFNWPKNLTSIESWAFARTCIQELDIPNTVTSIGEHVFLECSELTKVKIPETLENLAEGAFRETEIEELTCPGRFIGLIPLEKVKTAVITSGNSEGSLGGTFKDNTKLTNVELQGIQSVPSLYFSGCYNLVNVFLPATLNKINKNSFYGCVGLSVLTIPDSVSFVSDDAFEGTGIQTLITPAKEWVKKIPKSSLRKVITTSGETLHEGSFDGASELTEVELHEGIINFQHEVFRDCSKLEEISLPSTVETMESDVFKGCSSLVDIYILDKNKDDIDGAPWGIEGAVRIHWKDGIEFPNGEFYFKENNGKVHTYQVDSDQTWEDWIQSQYNTDGFYMMDNNVCAPKDFDTYIWVCFKVGQDSHPNDIIIANHTYSTTKGG